MTTPMGGAGGLGHAPPLARLLSLFNSTLSTSHELLRSLSLVSQPSPSLSRTVTRNLSTLAVGLTAHRVELKRLDAEAKRGKVGVDEVRIKEDELAEIEGAWKRLVEMLESDERSSVLLDGVKQSHPALFRSTEENASSAQLDEAEDRASRSGTYPDVKPYRDEPTPRQEDADEEPFSSADVLASQRAQMEGQDTQLDSLSASIGRQHHLSLQMNEELGTQAGLLEEFDRDVDGTTAMLGRANRRMDKLTKSMKEHASTWTIFVLIVILVFLIAVFK